MPAAPPIFYWVTASAVAALSLLSPINTAAAAQPASSEAADHFFESKIRPILVDNCFHCHAAQKQKGGLRLDSRAAILSGGDDGPALVAGQPGQSLLIKAVRQEQADLKMPPGKKLSSQQIADLTHWVALGAPWPNAKLAAAVRARKELQVTDQDRKHWAFQPVRRPASPSVRQRSWVANPIDAFVLHRLETAGLKPNPPAAPRELVRRLYYDLTGLPPSPAETESFAADPSPAAYQKLVDGLLASPRYGEKWARYWLDLVRFAETNSYERDNPKPNAWRYRDYVIRAFNDDKPYDRFVREQLAGDELPDRDSAAIIATGYYRLGIWDDEPVDALQSRYDGLDDVLATTSQVFLGLTVDCARCHDHKIDPIPQKDYYRLLSFFQNINPYRNGGPTDEAEVSDAPESSFDHSRKALCVTEAGARVPDTYVLLRGNAHVHGDKVDPAFPEIFGVPAPTIPAMPAKAKSCGRRLVLANWIASNKNPLTARVIANRVWQDHFGRGIVRSASNFGVQGDRPTHPELLDWLASELVEGGWHLKKLHRLIVLSNAYRMSSQATAAGLAADPGNDLFWRLDMRRLSAEEIRDSILAVSGNLNLKMYGPGVYPEISAEVMAGQSRPGYGWGKSPPEEQNRRSIYIHVKRSLLTPIIEAFDVAETDRPTPVRFATTQPTQALHMLNGAFLNRQAALLAERLHREAGTDTDKCVTLCLRLCMGRLPRPEEVHRGAELVHSLQHDGLAADKALADFCLVALNLNEFIYLD